MADNRTAWIAVGVVAAIVLGGGMCVCVGLGGVAWLVTTTPDADRADAQAQSDGFRDGASRTGEACVRTAIDRRIACGGQVDIFCTSQATAYVTACLGASSAVEPALCAGVVPGEGNYDWQGTFCEARGHSALGTCADVAAGVVAYCNLR